MSILGDLTHRIFPLASRPQRLSAALAGAGQFYSYTARGAISGGTSNVPATFDVAGLRGVPSGTPLDNSFSLGLKLM